MNRKALPHRIGVDLIRSTTVFLACLGTLTGGVLCARAQDETPIQTAAQRDEAIAFFERRIRPLFIEHCSECHSGSVGEIESGLDLDHRRSMLAGGDRGPAVIPGKADESLLMIAVSYDDTNLQMPPHGRLRDEQIRDVMTWVENGAQMPIVDAPSSRDTPSATHSGIDWDRAREHWSFRSFSPDELVLPKLATEPTPAATEIDAWVGAALHARGLSASPPASRRVLLRRLSLDLRGIVPSWEEVQRFENDTRPDAYQRVVDRYLASPQYGERWGRHWLDLMRYTDETASWLNQTGAAFRYRDWVIESLNEDLSYDRFVRLQLAADQITDAAPADVAALGFLGLSPTYWKEPRLAPDVIRKIVAEEWEERIDTIGRTFLGLTIACARCHDHKFDPITQADYYALAGVLASTRLIDIPLLVGEERRVVDEAIAEAERLHTEIHKQKVIREGSTDKSVQDAEIAKLESELAALQASTPHYDAPRVNAVADASLFVEPDGDDLSRLVYHADQPRDLAIQLRGNPETLGEQIPRRYLTLFDRDDPTLFSRGSGRLDLVDQMFEASPELVARVIVNRIWQHHFGRALVSTPSNFGLNGEPPSHPELLDRLAMQLIEQDWSLKWLHRTIVLSDSYRRSSQPDELALKIDPENRWIWRVNVRPLEIEAWRDSVLAVTGRLDRQMFGPAQSLDEFSHRRRTIYGTVQRRELNRMLKIHNFPEPTAHRPERESVISTQQQLFALNGDFAWQAAEALARQSLSTLVSDNREVDARLVELWRNLYLREPSAEEVTIARQFLEVAAHDHDDLASRWTRLIHAMLISNEFVFHE